MSRWSRFACTGPKGPRSHLSWYLTGPHRTTQPQQDAYSCESVRGRPPQKVRHVTRDMEGGVPRFTAVLLLQVQQHLPRSTLSLSGIIVEEVAGRELVPVAVLVGQIDGAEAVHRWLVDLLEELGQHVRRSKAFLRDVHQPEPHVREE